ncbi:MAG TPA: hypothetical protein VFZ23_09440 [Pyrinomonadaceae bacterium]
MKDASTYDLNRFRFTSSVLLQTFRKCGLVAVPVIAVTLLAIYPQSVLIKERGERYQGADFKMALDEAAYAAYVNSLMNGRPRLNDPFLGKSNSKDTPVPESFYSIQFIPPVVISTAARIAGIPAYSAFTFLTLIVSAMTCLAVFYFLKSVTRDYLVSAVGAIAVPCLGTAAALQGQLALRLDLEPILIEFFAFLRSYQPAFGFPFLFGFCMAVWESFTAAGSRRRIICSLTAGLLLFVLIFSYFYLWTTAVAWAVCLVCLWLIFRRQEARRALGSLSIIAAAGVCALIPYIYLLSNRSTKTDEIQLLVHTRMPDFSSPSLIIGLAIAVLLILEAWRKSKPLSRREVLLTLSLALTPLIVLNQQVVTGRSLQDFHYELFVSSYLIILALVLLVWIVGAGSNPGKVSGAFKILFILMGVAATVWGYVESSRYTRRQLRWAIGRDEAIIALRHIEEVEKSNAEAGGPRRLCTVHSSEWGVFDLIPVATPCRPLWNFHSSSAGGLSRAEEKRLFYSYLYYSDIDSQRLATKIGEEEYNVVVPIFGFEKVIPKEGKEVEPITAEESAREIAKYADFYQNAHPAAESAPKLDYIVVETASAFEFKNIDRWYERFASADLGRYTVYRLRARF